MNKKSSESGANLRTEIRTVEAVRGSQLFVPKWLDGVLDQCTLLGVDVQCFYQDSPVGRHLVGASPAQKHTASGGHKRLEDR